jgi:hypothetical protein
MKLDIGAGVEAALEVLSAQRGHESLVAEVLV